MAVRKTNAMPSWIDKLQVKTEKKENIVGSSSATGESFECTNEEIALVAEKKDESKKVGINFKTAEIPVIEERKVEEKPRKEWENITKETRASHGFNDKDMFLGNKIMSAHVANITTEGGRDKLTEIRPNISNPNILGQKVSEMAAAEKKAEDKLEKLNKTRDEEYNKWETDAAAKVAGMSSMSISTKRIGSDIGSGTSSRLSANQESIIHSKKELPEDNREKIEKFNEENKKNIKREEKSENVWEKVQGVKSTSQITSELLSRFIK